MFDFRSWIRARFAQSNPSAQTNVRRPKLGLATLEDRAVPSAVFINGTNDADTIVVSGDKDNLVVQASPGVQVRSGWHNGPVVSLDENGQANISGITSLTINGRDGDDFIDASNFNPAGLSVSTTVKVGGSRVPVVIADGIEAGGVAIFGGNGDDFIIGTIGNDLLDGGNGTDTIYGDPLTVNASLSAVGLPSTSGDHNGLTSFAQGGLVLTGFDNTGNGFNPTPLSLNTMVGVHDNTPGFGVVGGSSSWGGGTRAVTNIGNNRSQFIRVDLADDNAKVFDAEFMMNVRFPGNNDTGSQLGIITLRMFDGETFVGEEVVEVERPASGNAVNGVTASLSSNVPFDRVEIYALNGVGDPFRFYLVEAGMSKSGLEGAGDDTFIRDGKHTFDTIFGGGGFNTVQLEGQRNASDRIPFNEFTPANNIQRVFGGTGIRSTGDDNVLDLSGVTHWDVSLSLDSEGNIVSNSGGQVLAGAGDDVVTTSLVHTGQHYNGERGNDTINIVLNIEQLNDILADDTVYAQLVDYVANPNNRSVSFSWVSGDFSARSFGVANVLLETSSGLKEIDLTQIPGKFAPADATDFIQFTLGNGSNNKFARYQGETERMDTSDPTSFSDPLEDGNLINISATGGNPYFWGGRLRLGVGNDVVNAEQTLRISLGDSDSVAGRAWIGVELAIEGDGAGFARFYKDGQLIGLTQSFTSERAVSGGKQFDIIPFAPGFDLAFDEIELVGVSGGFGIKGSNAGRFYFA